MHGVPAPARLMPLRCHDMNSRCYSLFFFTSTAFCYSIASLLIISAAATNVVVLFFLSLCWGGRRGYIKVQVQAMLDFCLVQKRNEGDEIIRNPIPEKSPVLNWSIQHPHLQSSIYQAIGLGEDSLYSLLYTRLIPYRERHGHSRDNQSLVDCSFVI